MPYLSKARNNEYLISLREKRRARGDCQRCGKRKSERFANCLECRQERQRYYHKKGR
jgi:hypothetical protein